MLGGWQWGFKSCAGGELGEGGGRAQRVAGKAEDKRGWERGESTVQAQEEG